MLMNFVHPYMYPVNKLLSWTILSYYIEYIYIYIGSTAIYIGSTATVHYIYSRFEYNIGRIANFKSIELCIFSYYWQLS